MIELLKRLIHGDNRPPHEIFPEILHWQEGDDVESYFMMFGSYESVSEDGYVYIRNIGDHLHKYHIRRVAKAFKNKSLRDRMLEDEGSGYRAIQRHDSGFPGCIQGT